MRLLAGSSVGWGKESESSYIHHTRRHARRRHNHGMEQQQPDAENLCHIQSHAVLAGSHLIGFERSALTAAGAAETEGLGVKVHMGAVACGRTRP